MKLSYQAYNKSGELNRGTIEAVDVNEATEKLRRRGLYVTQIGETAGLTTSKTQAGKGKSGGRIRRLKHLSMFARQLYVLVSSGTRVVESLIALEQQIKDERWRHVISDIRNRVEEGSSIADATAFHPDYFDPVSQNLIAAGETTGKLPEMLNRLAKLTERQIQVRNALTGAMIYPSLLIIVAIGVLTVMLMFVLPRFSTLFEILDVPLPPTTKALVMVSEFLQTFWWAVILATVLCGFGLRMWITSQFGKRSLDLIVLRMPHIGRITRNFATARIARLLGIMLDSYLPLLEVLGLIRQTMGNVYYAQLIGNAEEAVMRGEAVSSAFAKSDLITPSVCQIVRAGEQSGQVAALLLNLADIMDEENEVIVKSLTSIVEPLILVALGGVVGVIALSMFMPLFDLMGGSGGGG